VDRQSQVMKSTERHFVQNTERTYHCIIMHIFKKQKQKQCIIKLNKQIINLILEKMLSTSEVGPIFAPIAPSPFTPGQLFSKKICNKNT
jgi:hypothetical protein